jgi:predicted dehydrogenase
VTTHVSAEPRVYRGVVIGAGGVARASHLPAYLWHPAVRQRLEIVGVVEEAAAAAVDGLPLVRRADLDALGPIDFIDICTPTASHLPLALWGLARGCHVLCEKPVALNRAEARQLARAARRAGRVVIPCHQYRFNPVWSQVTDWLQTGEIGRWHLAEWTVQRPRADAGGHPALLPWRGQRSVSRGGVLLDHGTHLIYQLLDLAGPPRTVTAWMGSLRHPEYDVEDTATVQLGYGSQRLATILLTWAGAARENRVRFTGERGVIEWSGNELRLECESRTERLEVGSATSKAAYGEWFAQLFERFAGAMDRGRDEAALNDIRSVATVLELAYVAARSGRSQVYREDG